LGFVDLTDANLSIRGGDSSDKSRTFDPNARDFARRPWLGNSARTLLDGSLESDAKRQVALTLSQKRNGPAVRSRACGPFFDLFRSTD
jgi:hypothetical protein